MPTLPPKAKKPGYSVRKASFGNLSILAKTRFFSYLSAIWKTNLDTSYPNFIFYFYVGSDTNRQHAKFKNNILILHRSRSTPWQGSWRRSVSGCSQVNFDPTAIKFTFLGSSHQTATESDLSRVICEKSWFTNWVIGFRRTTSNPNSEAVGNNAGLWGVGKHGHHSSTSPRPLAPLGLPSLRRVRRQQGIRFSPCSIWV